MSSAAAKISANNPSRLLGLAPVPGPRIGGCLPARGSLWAVCRFVESRNTCSSSVSATATARERPSRPPFPTLPVSEHDDLPLEAEPGEIHFGAAGVRKPRPASSSLRHAICTLPSSSSGPASSPLIRSLFSCSAWRPHIL